MSVLRSPGWLISFCVCLAASFVFRPAVAQEAGRGAPQFPFPFPQGDGQFGEGFFDQFFGPLPEAEQEALASIEVTPAEEASLGEAAWRDLLAQFQRDRIKVTNRGREAQYLSRLVNDLAAQMTNRRRYRTIEVYLADTEVTDARAVPGGKIIFSRGMLEFAESEAALAGVAAHELSHIDRGHLLLPIRRARLSSKTLSSEGGFDLARMMQSASTLTRLWSRPFRPEDEAQADDDATIWIHRAGYDSRRLALLLERMHQRDKDKPAAMLPGFLRTHPYHADRARSILERQTQLQKDEPNDRLYIGVKNLRQRKTKGQQPWEAEWSADD